MGRLDGKVAIVTGGARGQGAAAVRRFVAEGARVVIGDILDDVGKQLADELGEACGYEHLDVSAEQPWADVVAATQERWGRLDVLVNNAGVLVFGAVDAMPLADFERVIRINQVGTFLGMRSCVPAMKRSGGGSIINVSSVEGLAGMAGLVGYAGTKFAIRGMSKVAAVELAPAGIRVNSIHPGAIDTDMVSSALGGMTVDNRLVGARVPMGRVGLPDEVAGVVLFLASDESSYVTGGEYAVDGGATATHSLGAPDFRSDHR